MGMVQGEANAAGVREGDVLAGKYRVERVLGVGGMGVVVAAHHIQLDQKVALKFLRLTALYNPDAATRFAREARAAVKIKSEHVARVIDVGTLDSGAPYMVMEYLEGTDLAAWLKTRGRLPVEQAVEFVLQACVAVADAHALGIVHRDLKPANLFCVRRSDGQLSVKVLDFGISKMTESGGGTAPESFTQTSDVLGSPSYMSPEQMRSAKDVDALTDIWALGVILFELVAGRPAFVARSLTELVLKVTNDPPPPLRSLRPDAPPGLEAVVSKCLQKDPRQRYRNVADLAQALAPFAPKRAQGAVDRIAGIMESAGLSVAAPSPYATSLVETGTGFGNTKAGGRRVVRPALAILGVVATLVALVVVAFVSRARTGASAATLSSSPTVASPSSVPSETAASPMASSPTPASATAAPASAAPPAPRGAPIPTSPPARPRKTPLARPTSSAPPPGTQEHDVF
jgi:serine/threonine-protein kinase